MLSLPGRRRAAPHPSFLPTLFLALGLSGLGLAGARAATPEGDPAAAPPPPLGWSSSGHFGCDVSEQLIRETADAMVSAGLRSAGYRYIVVDGCWHAGRDAAGNLVADPERFASGMKALASLRACARPEIRPGGRRRRIELPAPCGRQRPRRTRPAPVRGVGRGRTGPRLVRQCRLEISGPARGGPGQQQRGRAIARTSDCGPSSPRH